MTHRFAALLFALTALALATPVGAQPQVEVIIDQQPQPQPEPPADPFIEPEDGRAVGTFAAWGSGFRLSDLTFTFSKSEVAAADGARLQVPDRANLGGITFGSGFRPLPWLRLPELRLRFGGGSAEGPWTALGNGSELEARTSRYFVGAIDLIIGVEVPLRRVTPFLRGYATAGFASVRVDVQHPSLGALGTEHVVRGWVGAGMEAGFIVHFADEFGLTVAYRHGFLGPEGHSVILGLAILGDD